MLSAGEPETCEVWPENWPTLLLFLAVSSQWRYAGMGQAVGLDYTAVDVTIRYRQMEVTPQMFEDLQAMERGALQAWAKARGR